jgi:cytochrome c peroxidase
MKLCLLLLPLVLAGADRPATPSGLDAYFPVPETNPLTREKVELGKRLFSDTRLSGDNSISCATCHNPQLAFTDDRPVSVGIDGRKGNFRVPRLVNRGYGKAFFWDGRAGTLEEQVMEPVHNPKEMDLNLDRVPERTGLPLETVRNALASYVRTIFSGDSPYDKYILGDQSALTSEQRLGLRVFRTKAGCTSCHLGPNFTDERFHNTGIEWPQATGRFSVSKVEADRGAFKTPSLREVARTPPYMHDGSLKTIDEVIDYYDKGGQSNPFLDIEIRELHLTAEEKRVLAAFLKALNGTVRDGM